MAKSNGPGDGPKQYGPEPRPKVRDGDPFAGTMEKRPKPPVRFYAVRQIRGPIKHDGFMTIKAHDESDAKRQWFNAQGQAARTHAYDLQVVELDRNHPAVKDAIAAPNPVNEAAGVTLAQMMDADFSAVQQTIAEGGKDRSQPGPTVKQGA